MVSRKPKFSLGVLPSSSQPVNIAVPAAQNRAAGKISAKDTVTDHVPSTAGCAQRADFNYISKNSSASVKSTDMQEMRV